MNEKTGLRPLSSASSTLAWDSPREIQSILVASQGRIHPQKGFPLGEDQDRLHGGLCLPSAGPDNRHDLAPLDIETLQNSFNLVCKFVGEQSWLLEFKAPE